MDYGAIRERVRAARRERGLSQERLAELSEIGRVTIARFEAGDDQDLRVGTLLSLCRPVGLELAVIGEEASSTDGGRGEARRIERRLVHARLAVRLLLAPPRVANASIARAAAVLDRWRRHRTRSAQHLSRWRSVLSGPRERVARALMRQSDRTDALFEDSPFEGS